MLDRSGLRRAANAPRLAHARPLAGRPLATRKTIWWQLVVPAFAALAIMTAWVVMNRHAGNEAPSPARAENPAPARVATGPSADPKPQARAAPEARPAAQAQPASAPAVPAPSVPAPAIPTPTVAAAPMPAQPRGAPEMSAASAPPAASPAPAAAPDAAGPAPVPVQDAAALPGLPYASERVTPGQAAPDQLPPPRSAAVERVPAPENLASADGPTKPEPRTVAGRDLSSEKPAQVGANEALANVKAPATASLDCVPAELRKVVADTAARFGAVTILSTHTLNTPNHAKGSVRHKLHTACRAVDFRIDAKVAAVTAYLRSRSELAGIESYRDGVIHIDASERIKGVAARPRSEPASARAN